MIADKLKKRVPEVGVVLTLVINSVALLEGFHHVLSCVGNCGECTAAPNANVGDGEVSEGGPPTVPRLIGNLHVVLKGTLANLRSAKRGSLVNGFAEIKSTISENVPQLGKGGSPKRGYKNRQTGARN